MPPFAIEDVARQLITHSPTRRRTAPRRHACNAAPRTLTPLADTESVACIQEQTQNMDFSSFNLSKPVNDALQDLGFTEPTPIQAKALPPLLEGRDVIGKAETGSGKTLAFGLPMMEKIDGGRVSIQALVVCPTRELAQQVADGLRTIGEKKGIGVVLVTGGEHIRTQRMRIPGNQVVVGTPGRLLDLLGDRFLPIEWAEYVVLDEFDRLLDMGFIADIQKIFKRLPTDRQTALFSATVPKDVLRHANALMRDPVTVETSKGVRTVANAIQRAVKVRNERKMAVLERLLFKPGHENDTVIVFCNTKREVRAVDRDLWVKDLSVGSLSGDYDQSVRFKVIARFRNKEIRVLVATDVAARGLDIDHVAHVINYDVPFEVEDYVHRIGRTARAGRSGLVTTLVSPKDMRSMDRIRREVDQPIELLSQSLESTRDSDSDNSETSEKPRRSEGSGRGRGRGQRRGRDSKPQDRAPKPIQNDTDDSTPPSTDETEPRPSRPVRERTRSRDRGKAGGHRRRADYQKWEEERLNSPIELIPDEEPPPEAAEPGVDHGEQKPRDDSRGGGNRKKNRRRDRGGRNRERSADNDSKPDNGEDQPKKKTRRRRRRGRKPTNAPETDGPSQSESTPEGPSDDGGVVW